MPCRRQMAAMAGTGGHHAGRLESGGDVLLDRTLERGWIERERGVDRDPPEVVETVAGELHALVHRAVRLHGGIDRETRPGADPRAARLSAARALPRGEQRHQRGGGRRVLDDADEVLRQAQHLPEPVHRRLLELGGRG